MELTCSRCHQTVQPGDCYCPVCGLPQLIYAAEGSGATSQSEQWSGGVRDASSIAWKAALRLALALAVPAGVICAVLTRAGVIGLLLMPAAAAWVVALYMRSERPAWITIGAGARIGLVTGILGSWTAAFTTGVTLYAMRFWFHQGKIFDDLWQNQINEGSQQLSTMGFDSQTIAATKQMMISADGRATAVLFNAVFLMAAIIAFSVAGGALGARFLGRPRQSGN